MGRSAFKLIAVGMVLVATFLFAPATGSTKGSLTHAGSKTKFDDNSLAAATIGKIAFASDRDGNLEIYLMDADGGGQIRLTEDAGEDYSPSWSPDGKRLAFVSTRDGNAEIYLMNIDGTGQTRLTNNSASDLHPAWAPDGAHIAFVTNRDGNDEIYLMNVDGSNQTNLTKNRADDSSFAYSPDGDSIVFASTREDNQFDLFVMNAAGGAVVRLTQSVGDDIDPSWSTGQISFQSNRDDNDEIYTMGFAGQNQTRLTSNTELDEDPAQATNGTRIVFASTRDGNFEIYAVNADGSGLTRLTTNSSTDVQPAVQPQATIPLPPAGGSVTVQFSATDFSANEGDGAATLTVIRSGSSAAVATVDYATVNGSATNRTDYTANFGTLRFNAGETSKTIRILLTDDSFMEGVESLTVTLSNPTGAALGTTNTATLTISDNNTPVTSVNPIDDARFFVNQHYNDFLGRAPDQAGLDFWSNRITQCGNNPSCVITNRNGVSAAFFIETEFQDTGFFVYRLYKGALGVQPTYQQFIMDRSRVVGSSNLAADKLVLANDFVTRDVFLARYPANQTNTQFVNLLFDTAGLTPFTAERAQLIQDMNNGKTRAQAVIQVIEIQQFKTREFNPAFVLMQYLGYLRRDPDAAGYAFWLDVLNRDPGNTTGMVCSFITSSEYQLRFGPAITASNSQCSIH
jgi:Tol biopolymer transport system component